MMLFSVTLFFMLSNQNPIAVARTFHKNELEQQQWVSFKTQFNKTYESKDEDYRRMKIYLDNADEITKHNELFEKGEVSFRMALNKFSDLTLEEFSQLYLSRNGADSITNVLNNGPINTFISSTPPEEKNWVEEDFVTEIKDQGCCKCGWAFAAAAAIESQMAIKSKNLTDLSVQNLLDCTGTNSSCDGGFTSDAFEYAAKNGIQSEEDYDYYHAKKYMCKYDKDKISAKIKSYKYVPSEGDESILKEVVGNIGPVTAAVDAQCDYFRFYTCGILNTKLCSNDPNEANHRLLIVGYGETEEGEEYWLLKNSYGEDWGEKGYIKIARNLNNTCGIANENYYPIV